MTYLYTSPDSIPYPTGASRIGDSTSPENLRELLQQQAVLTQAALAGRDSVTPRGRGNADGIDLNSLWEPKHFGTWEVFAGNSPNLPSGFQSRGALEVIGGSQFSVTQRITARDQNRVYRRTATNTTTNPVQWSGWLVDRLPDSTSVGAIAMVGDSLAASHNLAESLNTLLPGVNVYKRAWNGETSDGILWRLGALPTYWTVAGGTIPAGTTPVTVTTTQKLALPDFATNYTGSLNGVPGVIRHDGAGGFEFTRTTAGASTPAPNRILFDTSWTATTATHILGIIMGRNDVSLGSVGVDSDVASHVAGNFVRLVDWMVAQKKIFFVMGTINRTNEPRGHARHSMVVELNDLVRGLFPGNFIDVRRYLIDQCIYDLGITPTPEDLENIANDCPPPSVMVDITHYTDAAAAMISEKLLKPWLIGKGYYVP